MTNRTPRASAATEQRQALQALCATRLRDHNLIIASNRGPVEFFEKHGQLAYRRGQGGLVTAITSMAEVTPTTWVASVMSHADARVAAEHEGRMQVPVNGHPLLVSFVQPNPQQYHRYYDQIANAVLWFLQHNITNAPAHPTFDTLLWQAWDEGYVEVNRLFAERLAEEARR
ncbi:MAG TPA: trehalose-6-phosphate synthase, partial [Oscillatoriaceae cyanobacterium]